MTGSLDGLRKVLALERERRFSDSAVVGGLDAFLLNFAREAGISTSHPVSRVMQSLPPGGYRALHPIQRERVVNELLRVAGNGAPHLTVVEITADEEEPEAPRKAVTTTQAAQRKTPPPKAVGNLDSPVSVFPLAKARGNLPKLERAGIRTVRDLLFHFPKRYHDYSEVRPIAGLTYGDEQTVIAHVQSVKQVALGRRRAAEAIIGDETGTIRVLWFGQPWVAQRLRSGMKVALSGKIGAFRNRMQMENPEIESLDDESIFTRRFVPVYRSTEGLAQVTIRNLVKAAIDSFADRVLETLPEAVLDFNDLMEAPVAIRKIHSPDSLEEADAARRRLAFEELLWIELGVVRRRREWQDSGGAPVLDLSPEALEGYVESLPFALTASQRRAIDEVLADMGDSTPMTRLLEGDVGSGKTVVAAAALLATVASGKQGAIMAPTEILAEQHLRTFTSILNPGDAAPAEDGPWFQESGEGFIVMRPPYMSEPVRVALLTGSLKASAKAAVQEAIARGEVDIAVGTHALLQESVSFKALGVAVIDEQHRFGVEQRSALREKGGSPHVLVMTATPIPRTLALTVYGDLDITVLREMPPGRPPVKTFFVPPRRREEAFRFARTKVDERRQAYIICPLVEESEAIEAKAAVQEYERLKHEEFPDLRLGLLHGRMSSGEKEATMRAFRDHELDILVSTSVVEVGVDVPNATVILIEGADRFGLSQLHQFRGRVRRSEEQGYCFLLSETQSEDAMERLMIMETMESGFDLAEEDLRIRGPGEYFGTRQSGLPDLKVASLTDVEMIEETRREATRILDEDPELEAPEHITLRANVNRIWDRVTPDVS
ncbi:MAG TPA: ATP-dependent DNA helicase RecG [Dehalococcoidia bacterium]|nr:ATP-dependent DNA helicase RecG [Dehalococcoidia bacterium]